MNTADVGRASRGAFGVACRALGGRPAVDPGTFWIETRAGEMHARYNDDMHAVFCRFASPAKAVLALGDVRRVPGGVNTRNGAWVHESSASIDDWKRKVTELRVGMTRREAV